MKSSKLCSASLILCAALALVACNKAREKDTGTGTGWNQATFSVDLVSTGETSATVQESATGDNTAPFFGFVTSDVTSKTETVVANQLKTISASWRILKTGTPKPETVTGLRRAGVPYRYVVFGLTPDGRTYGTPAEVFFNTTGDYKTGTMSVTYDGRDDKKNLVFTVSGTGEQRYDYAVFTKENAASYESDKELLNALMEEADPNDEPIKGDGKIGMKNLPIGEYVIYVYGVEDELIEDAYNPTLQYAKAEFKLERNFDVTYDSWLGNWTVPRGETSDVWVIEAQEEGKTYSITGIESNYEWPVTAVYNAEDGSFTIAEQHHITTVMTQQGEVSVCLFSLFNHTDNKTYVWGEDNYVFMRADFGVDETDATFTGLELKDKDGSYGDADGFGFYATVGEDILGSFLEDEYGATALPNTVKKGGEVPGLEPEPGYAAFLGTWQTQDGTKITIESKSVNKTFSVSGLGAAAELNYNKKDGTLNIFAQSVGDITIDGKTYPGFLLGLDSDGYLEDAEQNSPAHLLATATVSGSTLTIKGEEYKATYGSTTYDEVIVGLGIYGYDEATEKYARLGVMDITESLTKEGGSNPPATPYEAWLGDWEVTKGSAKEVWTISQNEKDKSYKVTGLDGQKDNPFIATYNASTKGFTIHVQDNLGTGTVNTSSGELSGTVGLYGNIELDGKIYYVTGDYDIATAAFDSKGNGILTPGTVNIEGYDPFTLVGLRYYIKATDGKTYSWVNTSTNLPNTMVKVGGGEDPGDPSEGPYADFIGTWYDASGKEFTIAKKVEGSTYTVTGLDMPITANFADGKIKFYCEEQLGTTSDSYKLPIYLFGKDSDGYLEDAAQNTDPYLLATGTLSGGKIVIKGEEYKATYGSTTYDEVIVGMGIYAYDENGVRGEAGSCYPLSGNSVIMLNLPATLSKNGSEGPSEEYSKWLGTWTVNKGSGKETWTITQNVQNTSYWVAGLDGIEEYPFVASFDATTGGFSIEAQTSVATNLSVELNDGSNFTGDLGVYGNILYQSKIYYITGNYTIATAAFNSQGNGVLTPGSVNIQNLGEMTLVGLAYYLVSGDEALNFADDYTNLPNTMVKGGSSAPAFAAPAASGYTWHAERFISSLQLQSGRKAAVRNSCGQAEILSVAATVMDKQKADGKKVYRKRDGAPSKGVSTGKKGDLQKAERTMQKGQRQSVPTSGTKSGKLN